MCCDNFWSKCECSEPVEWNDFIVLDKSAAEGAYDDSKDNQCSSCKYYYDFKCVPFRSWLKNYLLTDEQSEPITTCFNFESWYYTEENSDYDKIGNTFSPIDEY